MQLTSHAACQHLTALRAWCEQYLPGRGKPDVLRPGNVGVRRYIYYGHTTAAMHDNEYTPPPAL